MLFRSDRVQAAIDELRELELPTVRQVISDATNDPEPEPDVLFKSRGRPSTLAQIEKEQILEALEQAHWRQSRAAELLGVSPQVLNYKVKKLGITYPGWRKNKS